MRGPDEATNDAERRLLQDVAEQGIHVVHEAKGDGPERAYTVGMWESFGQPEAIVFGLEADVAAALLESLADEADEGVHVVAGNVHEGLLRGYPVRFAAVPKVWYAAYLPMALWAYGGDAFPAVQVVWPDKQGRWPWVEGVREGYRERQPVLERLPTAP